ncbi:hypothetical protein GN958_ATG15729 [Phytophthora infestans]|nr:hypothetical protein GN958_ATG15729 [Phytophthora infestans]
MGGVRSGKGVADTPASLVQTLCAPSDSVETAQLGSGSVHMEPQSAQLGLDETQLGSGEAQLGSDNPRWAPVYHS